MATLVGGQHSLTKTPVSILTKSQISTTHENLLRRRQRFLPTNPRIIPRNNTRITPNSLPHTLNIRKWITHSRRNTKINPTDQSPKIRKRKDTGNGHLGAYCVAIIAVGSDERIDFCEKIVYRPTVGYGSTTRGFQFVFG
mmetsp:Transcript_30767/g.36577  ORF Transcript_30767/g.36577 Transcript_30767/m.36577 type:complete len:140 (+) Transcript_30767:463-882(+)